jgi:hypothetical protein
MLNVQKMQQKIAATIVPHKPYLKQNKKIEEKNTNATVFPVHLK